MSYNVEYQIYNIEYETYIKQCFLGETSEWQKYSNNCHSLQQALSGWNRAQTIKQQINAINATAANISSLHWLHVVESIT